MRYNAINCVVLKLSKTEFRNYSNGTLREYMQIPKYNYYDLRHTNVSLLQVT